MTHLPLAHSEFILGGQRSGKSRRAETLARQWLDADAQHKAVMIATAYPWDDEMRARIARHQSDRAARVPGMTTVEETVALGDAIARSTGANTLVVVDCLTLWLTNLIMPAEEAGASNATKAETNAAAVNAIDTLLQSIAQARGPVVLVGNEIGLGVIPMGAQVREFVDTLGRLNQDVAAACHRVTLMVAGLPHFLKGAA